MKQLLIKKELRNFILFLSILFINAINASAQPSNDDCSGAIMLTVGASGDCPTNSVSGDATNATAEANNTISCDVDGNIGVWYEFAAPASGSILVNYTSGTATGNPGIVVYSDCLSTEVSGTCQNNPANLNFINGLTGGNTYYLLLWYDSGQGTFDICLEDVPGPPINNDCTNATGLTIGNGNCILIPVDNTTATESGLQPSCDMIGSNADLWYEFVAPLSGIVEFELVAGTSAPVEAALWDACNGNELDCVGNAGISDGYQYTGLISGNTYYLQLWNDINGSAQGDFEFCLFEATCAPPVFNVTLDNSSCPTGFELIVDVTSLSLATSVDISTNIASANSFTGVATGTYTLTGFSPGDAVTVTVTDSNVPTCSDFINITGNCPPINDDCINATTLIVGNNGDCPINTVTGDATFATLEADNTISCDVDGNYGVWYQFIAPTSGEVIINYTSISATGNPGIVLYSDCSSTEIVGTCQNNPAALNILSGLTGGTTYNLLLWYDSGQGTFDLCLENNIVTCPPSLTLSAAEAGTMDYESSGNISSTSVIASGAMIDYDSATDIDLNPDFEVVLGAVFCAFIDGCGGAAINDDDDTSNLQQNENNTEDNKNIESSKK